MKIGYTGSRNGMTEAQRLAVTVCLAVLSTNQPNQITIKHTLRCEFCSTSHLS